MRGIFLSAPHFQAFSHHLTYCKIWVVVIAVHPKGANRPVVRAMAVAALAVVTG
jgi:hypothetical protein